MGLVKKITDWLLEKEEEAAKSCAVPMQEIEFQIAKAEAEKEKLQKRYDEAISELDHVLERLHKIKSIETLRCQNETKK